MQKSYYTSRFFSFTYAHYKCETVIRLSMHNCGHTTKDMPLTSALLEENLPTIMSSRCFNPKNLVFAEEVKETEWGHLFEHILLENLCIEEINKGFINATHNGTTSWKYKEPSCFHIKVDIGPDKQEIWGSSLKKTVKLMQKILSQKKQVVS